MRMTSPAIESARILCERTVVCSPHFDDAVLNCWSVLERDAACAVVNVFTGAPAAGFTSWYDQVNGASSSAMHMHQRSLEDREALSIAGKTAIDLGLLEVQYRLRQSPLLHTIFRRVPPVRFVMQRLPFLRPTLYTTPAPSAAQLADAIEKVVPRASSFCAPAGIGGHHDHLLVREAGAVLASRGWTVRLYADLPYAVRYGWPAWVASPAGERRIDRASAFWARDLEPLRPLLGDPIQQAQVVRLTPDERDRKSRAVREYATQYASLNSSRTEGRLDQASTFEFEVYWELRPGAGDSARHT
jgi:LmbE family N-acetylglucosaminyl deacetylase